MSQQSNDLRLFCWPNNDALTLDTLRKAYYIKAKRCHPDKGGNKQELQTLSNAYERLRKGLGNQPASKSTRARPDTPDKERQHTPTILMLISERSMREMKTESADLRAGTMTFGSVVRDVVTA